MSLYLLIPYASCCSVVTCFYVLMGLVLSLYCPFTAFWVFFIVFCCIIRSVRVLYVLPSVLLLVCRWKHFDFCVNEMMIGTDKELHMLDLRCIPLRMAGKL